MGQELLIVTLLLLYFPTEFQGTQKVPSTLFQGEIGHFGGTPGFWKSCRSHDNEKGGIRPVPGSSKGKVLETLSFSSQ